MLKLFVILTLLLTQFTLVKADALCGVGQTCMPSNGGSKAFYYGCTWITSGTSKYCAGSGSTADVYCSCLPDADPNEGGQASETSPATDCLCDLNHNRTDKIGPSCVSESAEGYCTCTNNSEANCSSDSDCPDIIDHTTYVTGYCYCPATTPSGDEIYNFQICTPEESEYLIGCCFAP